MNNDAEAIVPVNALPIGTKLEEYIVQSVIGEGGFGIVYLAHDTFLGREVAIKEYLPGSLASRGAGLQVEVRQADKRELFLKGMRRFVNEAHILARFRHPALVSVMRFLETNGTAYMVMPFYRGRTLREMVRNGFRAKTTEDLFSILLPVLEGLTQIHSVECYHLDISSDNIMILDNGAPVLLDFGAARHTELSGGESTTIILKPGFAPIEQYGSDDSELVLGPWTDIYAISAVAYLLVTGVMPPVSVTRIMKDTLTPAVNYASPDLPVGVLKVVDTGLMVRPPGRQRTVKDYLQSLLDAGEDFFPQAVEDQPLFSTQSPPKQMNVPPVHMQYTDIPTDTSKPERNSAIMRWSVLFIILLVFAAVISFLPGKFASTNPHQETRGVPALPEE